MSVLVFEAQSFGNSNSKPSCVNTLKMVASGPSVSGGDIEYHSKVSELNQIELSNGYYSRAVARFSLSGDGAFVGLTGNDQKYFMILPTGVKSASSQEPMREIHFPQKSDYARNVVALNHDASLLAAIAGDGTQLNAKFINPRKIHIFDTLTGKLTKEFSISNEGNSHGGMKGSLYNAQLEFSPDGKRVAAHIHNNWVSGIQVWNIDSKSRFFRGPSNIALVEHITDFTFDSSGNFLRLINKYGGRYDDWDLNSDQVSRNRKLFSKVGYHANVLDIKDGLGFGLFFDETSRRLGRIDLGTGDITHELATNSNAVGGAKLSDGGEVLVVDWWHEKGLRLYQRDGSESFKTKELLNPLDEKPKALIKIIPEMEANLIPVTDASFSAEQVEKTEAFAYFKSKQWWLSRRTFFTPVVLMSKTTSTDTWLAVSREDFDQALRFRNTIDVYRLSQNQLGYSKQLNSNLANVALGNNDTLKAHSGAKISVLISPELKQTLKDKDLIAQRKILREYLLNQASTGSKEDD